MSNFPENINDLFDSYDLFSGTGMKKIYTKIKENFPDLPEEKIRKISGYLEEFYEYCLDFADIISYKYRTPFLPDSQEAQEEISGYIRECQKKYSEIDEKHITDIFSTACWLSNR